MDKCFVCGEKANMVCEHPKVTEFLMEDKRVCDFICYEKLVTNCNNRLREIEIIEQEDIKEVL